eukprot:scaffold11972_cov134-Amphora_coffeaeformis.AAC.3
MRKNNDHTLPKRVPTDASVEEWHSEHHPVVAVQTNSDDDSDNENNKNDNPEADQSKVMAYLSHKQASVTSSSSNRTISPYKSYSDKSTVVMGNLKSTSTTCTITSTRSNSNNSNVHPSKNATVQAQKSPNFGPILRAKTTESLPTSNTTTSSNKSKTKKTKNASKAITAGFKDSGPPVPEKKENHRNDPTGKKKKSKRIRSPKKEGTATKQQQSSFPLTATASPIRRDLPPLTPHAELKATIDKQQQHESSDKLAASSPALSPKKDAPGFVPIRLQTRRSHLPPVPELAVPPTATTSTSCPRTPRPDQRPSLTDVPLQISTPSLQQVDSDDDDNEGGTALGNVVFRRHSSLESSASSSNHRNHHREQYARRRSSSASENYQRSSSQNSESSDDDEEEEDTRRLGRQQSLSAGSNSAAPWSTRTPNSSDDEDEEKAMVMWKKVLESFEDPVLAIRRPIITTTLTPSPRQHPHDIFPGIPPRLAWSLMFTGLCLCLVLLIFDLAMGFVLRRQECDCSAASQDNDLREFPWQSAAHQP